MLKRWALASKINMESKHKSIMMKEVLEALDIQSNETVVDATIGGAGHFTNMLAALGEGGVIIGIDADATAVERGREAYARDRRQDRPIAHLVNDNFRNLSRILERLGIGQIDKILFDLGWNGYQIAAPRGFSFSSREGSAFDGQDQPLLMTYGEGGTTAADIVNSSSEEDLASIIFSYGEERFARNIAHSIVSARSPNRILTTGALVAAILAGTPEWYHHRKIHPATKTFQALRIATNDEIGALREGLSSALNSLAPNGRIAVISFHSIEDRVIKNILRDAAHLGLGTLMSKKPLVPSHSEIIENHRARSAKLRVFEKAATSSNTKSLEHSDRIFSYV